MDARERLVESACRKYEENNRHRCRWPAVFCVVCWCVFSGYFLAPYIPVYYTPTFVGFTRKVRWYQFWRWWELLTPRYRAAIRFDERNPSLQKYAAKIVNYKDLTKTFKVE